LEADNITFFKDLHMQEELMGKKYPLSAMTFVDTGLSLMNEETKQQVYFIKMVRLVHDPVEKCDLREIHLIAVSGDQFKKWEACLTLLKDPGEPDQFFTDMKVKVEAKIVKQLKTDD